MTMGEGDHEVVEGALLAARQIVYAGRGPNAPSTTSWSPSPAIAGEELG